MLKLSVKDKIMETKEIKIEVPQGYVIDKEKSTFEKIVLKKIDNRPKTWEEYCKLNIRKDCFTSRWGNSSVCCYHNGSYNEFQTEERIEQFIAIGKLMQLRDYWVKGYKKTEEEYVIYITRQGDIGVTLMFWAMLSSAMLRFPVRISFVVMQ